MTALPITAEQLKLIRKATTVVFRTMHGRSKLEASVAKYGETDSAIRTEVTCNHRLDYYPVGSGDYSYGREIESAFHMEHSAQQSQEWLTIAGFMRAADELELLWVANNSTESIRDAHLVADQLKLRISRKGKLYTFLIRCQCGEDNSARLVKVKPYVKEIAAA